jgi:hypothetical protein
MERPLGAEIPLIGAVGHGDDVIGVALDGHRPGSVNSFIPPFLGTTTHTPRHQRAVATERRTVLSFLRRAAYIAFSTRPDRGLESAQLVPHIPVVIAACGTDW